MELAVKYLAPLVARAWVDAPYKKQLLSAEWSQAELNAVGINSDVNAQFISDEPQKVNFVLPHCMESDPPFLERFHDVWFEPSRCNSTIEFQYFSPIRLPRGFIDSIRERADPGDDRPSTLPRKEFVDLLDEYRCNLDAVQTIVVWRNKMDIRRIVLPCAPDGLAAVDYPRAAKAGDWLYYATFANLLTTY